MHVQSSTLQSSTSTPYSLPVWSPLTCCGTVVFHDISTHHVCILACVSSCITVDTRCVILDMAIAENMCDVRGRGTDVGDSKKAIMYRTPRVRLELFESVGLQYSTLCAHSFPKPHSSTQEDSYSSLRRTNTMQSLNSSPMPPTLLHQDHLLNTLEPGQVRNVIRFVNYRDILLFPLEQDSGDTSFVPSK